MKCSAISINLLNLDPLNLIIGIYGSPLSFKYVAVYNGSPDPSSWKTFDTNRFEVSLEPGLLLHNNNNNCFKRSETVVMAALHIKNQFPFFF